MIDEAQLAVRCLEVPVFPLLLPQLLQTTNDICFVLPRDPPIMLRTLNFVIRIRVALLIVFVAPEQYIYIHSSRPLPRLLDKCTRIAAG